jgi:Tfp pilus assembly protein PilF
LRVVSRTSAFQFKGEKKDMRAIGQALNATHLIEGSVRKAGERVRITVQLIRADDGTNMWSENYDRELIDVFGIQEEIGRAIATSFNMRLGLAPGERLVSDRPADQETYELYLRGLTAFRTRSRQELELLGQVVERDPNFAPGWSMLAQARLEMGLYFERRGEASKRGPLRDGAETAARRAIALAPGYAGGYAALASITAERGKWIEAMDLFKQGLARDPEDPELLGDYGAALRRLGYLKESLAAKEQQHLLDPLVPLYNRQRAELLLTNGQADAGVGELERLHRQNNAGVLLVLPAAYAQQGRFAEAADLFDTLSSGALPYLPISLPGPWSKLLRKLCVRRRTSWSLPRSCRISIRNFISSMPTQAHRNGCSTGPRSPSRRGTTLVWVAYGGRCHRAFARLSGSRRSSATPALSTTGRRAGGRICASPSAPTISPASEIKRE